MDKVSPRSGSGKSKNILGHGDPADKHLNCSQGAQLETMKLQQVICSTDVLHACRRGVAIAEGLFQNIHISTERAGSVGVWQAHGQRAVVAVPARCAAKGCAALSPTMALHVPAPSVKTDSVVAKGRDGYASYTGLASDNTPTGFVPYGITYLN